MRLKFLVNKKYVLLHALNQNQLKEPFSGWKEMTLKFWDRYPQELYFLAGFPEWILINTKRGTIEIAKSSKGILAKLFKTHEAEKLIDETVKYKNKIEKEWNKKGNKALSELEKIIRIPLPTKEIKVYITHPSLNNGLTVSPDIIVWGHKEEWKNYSIVYLCHELLHTIFWDNPSEITHAIIELATDQELRIRLNKKGEYFDISGHKNLIKIERKILPEWKKYLNTSSMNIIDFIKKTSGKLAG